MRKYAKIINEETKEVSIGAGTNVSFYQSIGMTEMDVEEAYNNLWYLQGYAPNKSSKEATQEKIIELKMQLAETDYIDNKFIEAIVKEDKNLLESYKIKYQDKLEERQSIRNQIDELEEIVNGR